jgi:hypothetical protein
MPIARAEMLRARDKSSGVVVQVGFAGAMTKIRSARAMVKIVFKVPEQ